MLILIHCHTKNNKNWTKDDNNNNNVYVHNVPFIGCVLVYRLTKIAWQLEMFY